MPTPSPSSASPSRTTQTYPGSCHCGALSYLLRLTLPPPQPVTDPAFTAAPKTLLYKCNCTTCQKMGFFHARPIAPEQDFVLFFNPPEVESGEKELGLRDVLREYRCFSKVHAWYFCNICGVRIVGTQGDWESVDSLDVEAWKRSFAEAEPSLTSPASTTAQAKDKKKQIFRVTGAPRSFTTPEGVEVTRPFYLSVNACTLDQPGGEDVDLVRWVDEGWVFYIDQLVEGTVPGMGKRTTAPGKGGMW